MRFGRMSVTQLRNLTFHTDHYQSKSNANQFCLIPISQYSFICFRNENRSPSVWLKWQKACPTPKIMFNVFLLVDIFLRAIEVRNYRTQKWIYHPKKKCLNKLCSSSRTEKLKSLNIKFYKTNYSNSKT